MRRRSAVVRGVTIVASAVAALAIVEAALASTLRHPSLLRRAPARTLESFRRVYGGAYRSIVQAERDFVVYDPELTYTLRPSAAFTHANSEFVTAYRTNRLGTRDTDEALAAPEIVVVGDSFAMGWGVGQLEAFPQRLGALTGRRTLNAAVSSYGTVRELKLLDRVDTRAMTHLVIQYADNDYEENARFYADGNVLHVSPRARYERERERYEESRRYFPAKYLLAFFAPALIARRADEADGGTAVDESKSAAWLFLNALLHAGRTDLSHARILLFELRPFASNDPSFVQSVDRERRDAHYPEFVRRIELLSFHERIGRGDSYVLDDHLRASGHGIIADTLARLVRGDGR